MLAVGRARVRSVACGVIGLGKIVDVNLPNGAWWVGVVACRGGMGKLALALLGWRELCARELGAHAV